MEVIKRDGRREPVKFDKITARIEKLCYSLNQDYVEPIQISMKVINGIYDGVTTVELDNLAAEICATLATVHPDYAILAARIAISNLQKNTLKSFSRTIKRLYEYVDPKTGENAGLISEETYQVVKKYANELNSAIIYDRDFNYDYFGFKTLERSYLLRMDNQVVERPQHMIMRVAVGIHGEDIEAAIHTYNLMSEKWFTHATPTLFNAGTPKPQMSSCFLLTMKEDSIDGIYDTLKDCAKISQSAGGIGLSIHGIRATGSYIKGTNGYSNGIIPMLRVFNDTARYIDQGGGKRKGAFAIYLEPWHADVFDFLDLKKNHGKEEARARDLFYALWIPDLFMKRVEADDTWSLFCPHEAPGLYTTYGKEFEALYEKYEREGKPRKVVKAQDLWFKILESQIETGTPYLLYKDAANEKSNQKNLGTIQSSNLCCITGDQRVPTNKGLLTIKELFDEGTENRVVGREKIESASEMYLPRPDAPIVKIITREGYSHKVTPDHKVWIEDEGWKEAQHLQKGDKIAIQKYEGLWGRGEYEDEAFLAGLISGDGTFALRNVHIDIWDNALAEMNTIEGIVHRVIQKYEDKFNYDDLTGNAHAATYVASKKPRFTLCNNRDNSIKYRMSSSILYAILSSLGFTKETKHQVPEFVWKGNRQTVARYLEGLYLADATVQAGEITTTSIASIHLNLLEDIQILWANFGVKTFINKMRDDELRHLPDGKGSTKEYNCKSLYRLLTTSIQASRIVQEVTKIGFYRNNKTFLDNIQKDGYSQKLYATFEGLEILPNEDAYCLVVDSEEHSWTVNGIITKNTEILEYTAPDETAVCNLASIALPKFVIDGRFDHENLFEVTKTVTYNLNKIIDLNYYPIPEARNSNMRHRPIGIGVQGLADAFIMLRMPFESEEARGLNKDIFETIYYAALTASMELAQKHGTYQSYEGSPISQGIFQFDMWGVKPNSGRWDWEALRSQILQHGVRNSLLLAPMPTASTSQILGNNECFEPYTSNIYMRRVLSGEFAVVNRHLLKDLVKLGLWDDKMKNKLIAANGSVQSIPEIPQNLKDIYKTTWEIKQKSVIDMAADRGAFICQSQSLNLHVQDPTFSKLSSMHFYGWKKGLKTGMYYLRTKAAVDAIKFTVEKQVEQVVKEAKAEEEVLATVEKSQIASMVAQTGNLSLDDQNNTGQACNLDDPDCEACGS